MKKTFGIILTLLIASMLVVPSVQAAETSFAVSKISYYGYLVDRNTDQPVDSAISITFRIYDEQSGECPIWEETHSLVNVSDGFFDVSLGSINALAGIDFNQDLWLGVEVNGDGEMTPCHKLPNLQSQMVEATDNRSGSKETSTEQIDYGQFGHAIIEITIDYNDISSSKDESSARYTGEEPAVISSNQLKIPQINITSCEFDMTSLQVIPIEEERVIDTEESKVYSNSPRAPGM